MLGLQCAVMNGFVADFVIVNSSDNATNIRIEINEGDNIYEKVQQFCQNYKLDSIICSSVLKRVEDLAIRYAPIKPTVHSFDIFDTILARDVMQPNDIFDFVETGFPYPNFRRWREEAGSNANGTFDDIYVLFKQLSGEPDPLVIERLKDFEIECELNHTYILEQNYQMIKNGDILITDMYLPYDTIARLLSNAGYKKFTNIYASAFGKSHGWMWKQLLTIYNIDAHLGDNYYSDVIQARKYGINAQLTELHKLSFVEKTLVEAAPVWGSKLALVLRRFRHRNPYPIDSTKAQLFSDQSDFNIALMLLISHELYDIMQREGLSRLLLTTRQGCLLEKLFPKLYPNIETIRFSTSRITLANPSREFIEYLQEVYLPGKSLIFDLHGTFNRGLPLFRRVFSQDPRVHIFVHRNDPNATSFPGLSYSLHEAQSDVFTILNARGQVGQENISALYYLEDLHVDLVGPLVKVISDENGHRKELRGPIITYTLEEAAVYHQAVELFIATVDCRQVADIVSMITLEAFERFTPIF